MSDRPTNRPTADRPAHKKVTLPLTKKPNEKKHLTFLVIFSPTAFEAFRLLFARTARQGAPSCGVVPLSASSRRPFAHPWSSSVAPKRNYIFEA